MTSSKPAPERLVLVRPTVGHHDAFLEAHQDWGPGLHEDGFGIGAADDVVTGEGFASWVARVGSESVEQQERTLSRWILEDGSVLGGIALRCSDDDRFDQIGNVGFGVRPSARGRGVASWALGQIIGIARAWDVSSLLLVCEVGNIASARTIEANGGRLDVAKSGDSLRYWIDVEADAAP